jgi:hypothetical protein
MTQHELKQVAISIVRGSFGDDLERARSAFAGCTPQEMLAQHGKSRKTRQQLLDNYQHDRDQKKAVLAWLEGVTP